MSYYLANKKSLERVGYKTLRQKKLPEGGRIEKISLGRQQPLIGH